MCSLTPAGLQITSLCGGTCVLVIILPLPDDLWVPGQTPDLPLDRQIGKINGENQGYKHTQICTHANIDCQPVWICTYDH